MRLRCWHKNREGQRCEQPGAVRYFWLTCLEHGKIFHDLYYFSTLVIALVSTVWLFGDRISEALKQEPIIPSCFTESRPDTTTFRILVLPFTQTKKTTDAADIGLMIHDRLQSLRSKDHLAIDICYLDSLKEKVLTEERADELRLHHRADMVIYGRYGGPCENNPEHENVCYRWCSDSTQITQLVPSSASLVPSSVSIGSLYQGILQGSTDFIIYATCALNALKAKNNQQAIDYLSHALFEADGTPSSSALQFCGELLISAELELDQTGHAMRDCVRMLDKSTDPSTQARFQRYLGWLKNHHGDPKEALAHARTAQHLLANTDPPDAVAMANILLCIGECHERLGELDSSLYYAAHSFEMQHALAEDGNEPYGTLGVPLAAYAAKYNLNPYADRPKVHLFFDLAIRILTLSGEHERDLVAVRSNYSLALASTGDSLDNVKAIAQAVTAIEEAKNMNAIPHSELASAHHNLAFAYSRTGSYQLAIKHDSLSLVIRANSEQVDHSVLDETMNTLIINHVQAGDLKAARDRLNEREQRLIKYLPDASSRWSSHYVLSANVYARAGEPDKGWPLLIAADSLAQLAPVSPSTSKTIALTKLRYEKAGFSWPIGTEK